MPKSHVDLTAEERGSLQPFLSLNRGERHRAYLKSHDFICSMSQKGDCWDNAPMEAFWGKMKTEWLSGRKFKTLAEAKAAVFEYVEIFYNRQRIHQSNGYLTPEAYFRVANN